MRRNCVVGLVFVLAGCGAGPPSDSPAGAASGSPAAGASDAPVAETQSEGPHKQVIAPPGASTGAPYSPGIRTGNLIFLSGAIGSAESGGLVEGGVGPETRRALEILQERLALAGATMSDVVKCTVFLADIADYGAMNEVYSEFFPEAPPARSTVAAGALVAGASVEIECFAAVRS